LIKTEVNPLQASRSTINPYRFALLEVWNRLKWDMTLQSWHSRKKLKSVKDKHFGQKAVIICNGPSLLKTDFSLLNGVFTFGLNKINLIFDKSNFRPSCIVAVNSFVIEQNRDFYNSTEIPLYLDSCGTAYVKPRFNTTFLHSSTQMKFAKDCSISVNQGYTVTFVAMQLAFHMGFNSVALIGCDHSFATKGQANKVVIAGEKDESHFDPNYFAHGVKWQLPDLVQSEVAYTLARDMYECYGRMIVNATFGGKLNIFNRMSLKDFIDDSS